MKSKDKTLYLINEEDLIELLENFYYVEMLERDGVDNWEWYGTGKKEILKENFPNVSEEELENLDFYDCAIKDLPKYRLAVADLSKF